MAPKSRVAILLTCFNRREKTLACLTKVMDLSVPAGVSLHVYLVDDGSDHTAEAVRRDFPDVNVLVGDGTLYWAGGMRKAWTEALRHGFDYFLWLNDDTELNPDALRRLLATIESVASRRAVVVGTTSDPMTGSATYGGVSRSSRTRPLSFRLVTPSESIERCQTMNGNCVLVPKEVVNELGIISSAFTHGMGDFDYGLRATSSGIPILIAPGFVGVCARDHLVQGSWRDRSLPRSERWRKIMASKELPPRAWFTFARRHGGPLWPLQWLSPYLRVLMGR